MKTKQKIKKENKQVVEIHIYIHQQPNFNGTGGTFTYQCTCGQRGATSAPCPVHPLNPPYIVTC